MLNIGTIIASLRLVDTLTPALDKARGTLKKTGARMRETGTSMTMGLTTPIVAGISAAAIAFGGFEQSMNRVKALTGATGEDFDKLSAQAKELGKTTKFSASEAADGMGFLAMAGFETTEIIAAMPGILQLAASAQIDLATAADITSNIMTGYGQSTRDLAHTNDVLVQAMTSANVDLRMLGESMKYVAPVAKAAGLSFEEATASIALMGNAGIQGSQAGTALRGAISMLLKPSKKASEVMRELGLNAVDSAGNLIPMADIVQQLGDESATTTQMLEIFGIEAGPAMVDMVSKGHESLRKMTGELENVGNVSQQIAEIQMQGLIGAFEQLKSASSGAMIEIGEQLAPVLISFLENGVKLSNWITDTLVPAFAALSPTTQKWVLGLVAAAAAAGPFLIVLGTLISAAATVGGVLAPLIPMLGFVGGGFSVVALAASPLLYAIPLLAVGFGLFKFAMWAKEAQIFGRALDWLKHLFGALSDEEYEAAKAARRFNKDLGDVTPAAEDLRTALGVAGVEGTVAELHTAMANLGGVVGGLAEDEMALLAKRAIELRDSGKDLTPELARIADQFIREQATAASAAKALKENAERTEALDGAVASLRDELSDAGLAGDLETLEGAWAALDDTQQDNVLTWTRASEAALELEERGQDLTGTLSDLASTAWLAEQPLPKLHRGYLATSKSAKGFAVPIATLIKLLPKVSTGVAVYGKELDELTDEQEEAALAAGELPTVFERIKGVLGGVADDMNNVFTAAFEGGGAALGALKSLATNAAEGFMAMIPVVGPFLSQFAGPIIAGIGKIGGAIKGLFGRGTTENLVLTASRMWGIVLSDTAAAAAADMAEQVGDDFGGLVLSLGTIIDQAGGVMAVGVERTAGAARTMFNAIDQGKIDADQALTGLLPVLQSMAAEFDNTDAAGQAAFLELIKLAEEFGLDMQAIVDVVGQDLVDQALGNDLPGSLQTLMEGLDSVTANGLDPMLARLVSLGVITEEQRQGFMEMAGQAVFDMKGAEAAAERYGIKLENLGPRYQNAKLGEQALQVAADFKILLGSGMAVEDVIAAQGDAIHAVVRDARWAGTAIPEAMRPAIQAWIDQGGAVDENGDAITDIAQLDFAKPIEERLASIMTSLGDLIQKFIDALTPVENLATEVENIPDANVDIHINMDNLPDIPDQTVYVEYVGYYSGQHTPAGSEGGSGWSPDGFAGGTGGMFPDFGAGTPVILHGRERITPIAEARSEASGMAVVEARLGSIERLLRDQPRAFGLAIQDSAVLSN